MDKRLDGGPTLRPWCNHPAWAAETTHACTRRGGRSSPERDPMLHRRVLRADGSRSGGHDIDPALRRGAASSDMQPHEPQARDGGDGEDLPKGIAMSRDMPVLGICGGMQVINIAAGGTNSGHRSLPGAGRAHATVCPENTDENTYTFSRDRDWRFHPQARCAVRRS